MAVIRKLEAHVDAKGVGSFTSKMQSASSSMEGLERTADDTDGALGSLKRALKGVGRSAASAIPGVNLAKSKVDELGDELTDTTGEAIIFAAGMGTAAGATGTLGSAAATTSLAAGVLKGALLGVGLVALPALIGPAVIAAGALGGIAGAFGLILGSGFLAWSSKSGNSLESLKKKIVPLIKQFGEKFVPLIDAAVNALPDFVKNVLKATGNLQPFVDTLKDLGGAAMKIIPKLVGFFFDLGREALPVVRKLGGFIMRNLMPALKDMKKQATQLWPKFKKFGQALWDILPPLISVSTKFVNVLIPALTEIAKWVGKGVTAIDKLISRLGKIGKPAQAASGKLSGARRAVKKFGGSTKTSAQILRKTFTKALKKTKQNLTTFADGLKTIQAGKFKQGFKKIGDAVRGEVKTIRKFLVGKSGNGGILNTMIMEAGRFLKNEANTILKNAAKQAFKTIVSALKNVKILLIGRSGSGGVVNNLIGEIASYLKSDAAKNLAKAAGKAFGQGIRAVVMDVYNAIIGKEPSIIGDLVGSIVSYLVNDAAGDLWDAATTLFNVLLEVAKGVYEGLIGNSLIKDMIGDIVSYFKHGALSDLKRAAQKMLDGIYNKVVNFKDDVKQAGEDLIGAFIKGIERRIGDLKEKINGVTGWIDDQLPGSDAKEGPLSNLTASGEALLETFAKGITSNQQPLRQALLTTINPPAPEVQLPTERSMQPQGGGTTINKNITIELGVPQGTAVDTAARTYADELKSRGYN